MWVDTSGWLEYFVEGESQFFFAPAIEDTGHLLVPVICIYETFRKGLQTQGQPMAEFRAADLVKGEGIELTSSLAMSAAILSAELKLPMADSVILATARTHEATLWTQDEHFKDIEGVQYIEKKSV
jgi:predicted nucleic acid-binding protein